MNRRRGDVLVVVVLLGVVAAVAGLTVLRVRSTVWNASTVPDVGQRAPHEAERVPSDGAPSEGGVSGRSGSRPSGGEPSDVRPR